VTADRTPAPAAIALLLSAVLDALERVGWVQRHLYPPLAVRLADELRPSAEAVAAPLRVFEDAVWPEDMRFLRDRLVEVARQTIDLVTAFGEAARAPHDPIGLYRALRRLAGVQEALYPLAPVFEAVSRWFLTPDRRADPDLVARLRAGALRDDDIRVGVLHAEHERGARGGFSLYVPEQWDGRAALPLVVALHGGHGHGH